MFEKRKDGLFQVTDEFRLNLDNIKSERKQVFIDSLQDTSPQKSYLYVTVMATHAGTITGNKMFYRPDKMRDGLPSFMDKYNKPVLLHHDHRKDAIGRVKAASYKDLSYKYLEPMSQFKDRYGGVTFTDAKVDTDKAFDQVQWVIKNLVPMKDYVGLGYGEVGMTINDADAAQKILDERYLTVSVGFVSDAMFCSICQTDWGSEDICEHERGNTYDGTPMLLIPGSFGYEEISYINIPADGDAKVLSISNISTGDSIQDTENEINSDNTDRVMVTPILYCVNDSNIYRLDSYKKLNTDQISEVSAVAKKKDSKEEPVKPATPELVEYEFEDGVKSQFIKDTFGLDNKDAKREHYITDGQDHKHRVIIDPETGNGRTDYVGDHAHDVVNREVKEAGTYKYDDETNEYAEVDKHVHALDRKVERLEDQKITTWDYELVMKPVLTRLAMAILDASISEAKDASSLSLVGICADGTDFDINVPDLQDEVKKNNIIDLYLKSVSLSEAQLSQLPADKFCGPNKSFPVTDKLHYDAALELIEKYEGPGNKDRIKASILLKGRDILTPVLSEPQVTELVLASVDNKEIKLAFTSSDDFLVAIKKLDKDMLDKNKDQIAEAAKVFGLTTKDYATEAGMAQGTPLPSAQAEAEREYALINESVVDKLVDAMLNKVTDDTKRKELGEYIVDKLIEKAIIHNVYEDVNKLTLELAQANEKINKLTKSNKDFYASKQNDLSRIIVSLKSTLKKPGFENLDQTGIDAKISDLKLRSIDSLSDALNDLMEEYAGSNFSNKMVTTVRDEPITPPLVTNDSSNREENGNIDLKKIVGLTDKQYRDLCQLNSRYKRITEKREV